MGRFREWFFPQLAPQERERRLRLFRATAIVQLVTAVLVVALTVFDVLEAPEYMPMLIGFCALVFVLGVVGYILALRGVFHLGVSLLVLAMLVFPNFFLAFYGTRISVSYLFLWAIMMAAVLLETPMLWLTTGVAIACYGGLSLLELYQVWPLPLVHPELFAAWHQIEDPWIFESFLADMAIVLFGYIVVTWFASIASRSLRRAVERTREQNVELEGYRTELEQRVAARTDQLNQTLRQLEASLETVREVGSPVLPIMEQVLLVPLIGALDSERMAQALDQVLAGVSAHHSRVVIVDITGVPMVDTAVASALLQMARGVRLLGATPVLVGIRGEVAQTMVALGVDLRRIVTRAGLQEGLEYAREVLGTGAVKT
jgi:anti-anti-sigma regulatory factor